MCGRLRMERLAFKLGNIVPITNGTETFHGYFNGSARSETLENWLSKGWKEGTLNASAFTEGKGEKATEFLVPDNKTIKIIYNPNTFHNSANPFNICTRESQGEELQVHDRWPVLIDKDS